MKGVGEKKPGLPGGELPIRMGRGLFGRGVGGLG